MLFLIHQYVASQRALKPIIPSDFLTRYVPMNKLISQKNLFIALKSRLTP